MASPAARLSSSMFCRPWSTAVAGMSRSFEGSSAFAQVRGYSDESSKDSSVVGAAESPTDRLEDPILSFDSPAESPIPGGLPPPAAKPSTDPFGASRRDYDKSTFPPRNHRTPRGVYKAIILGEVGQLPIQKILKSGKSVTILSVGTGGMYNNRRPFEGESPEEFAQRSFTQWHRVAVYQDRAASMVMQHVKIGTQVYLEGNMEMRVYNDPTSGIVKRVREIAIRANGRLMFMDTPIATPAAQPADQHTQHSSPLPPTPLVADPSVTA